MNVYTPCLLIIIDKGHGKTMATVVSLSDPGPRRRQSKDLSQLCVLLKSTLDVSSKRLAKCKLSHTSIPLT